MSGRYGRKPASSQSQFGRDYDEPDSPPSRRGPSADAVNASLERARNQLGGDSSDEAYGENPYGVDYSAEPVSYTRDRDDSLDEMVRVGDHEIFSYEPTETSPRQTDRSRPSPRGGYDRPSPRGALSLIHISEPTRLLSISYAVFCLKKKKKKINSQI
eukprot:TRINITY_DN1610_c0_g1_i5.p1 TRINITY_DN1610_c0_g1~~TRINITY_DN1610_c0_g1_i5.p1  ORF type:complete len:158 (-),score=29.26 TRINITY_DN1610_c0_g1_i5:65-538(-)